MMDGMIHAGEGFLCVYSVGDRESFEEVSIFFWGGGGGGCYFWCWVWCWVVLVWFGL